jgi:hypothetical protein
MSINPLFNPVFFETALRRARPISFEMDLARARRILASWTSLKRLSSDEVEMIVRMIAQGIAEGRRHGWGMAEAECPTDDTNNLKR